MTYVWSVIEDHIILLQFLRVNLLIRRKLQSEKHPKKLETLFLNLEEDKYWLKDTNLGTIFVTNLSSFPSLLSTILVTDGVYDVNYPQFRLKLCRISCSEYYTESCLREFKNEHAPISRYAKY
ncbi:hypothetical protein C2G38_2029186 [Gigaspora rosea]|uniref:STB6-like N-terminal domain-containing protein n=1 Tax=Gigaspora rosea TaxID=44941 RepID=A0A397VYU5_9GLOM|nr:hypothetical protein C2G38_2029186 [Gigaspora rosea]